jgi:hypothetical protein
VIRRLMRSTALASALLGVVAWATVAHAAADPYAQGSTWMSLRAGYAKATGGLGPDGGVGAGIGFSHMIRKQTALGFFAQYELLSKDGAAAEMAFPFTVELVRHFKWKTVFSPYFGVGGGGFNYRTLRSGDDHIRPATGYYVTLGGNLPVSEHQLLGVDLRVARAKGQPTPANPTFGEQDDPFTTMGLKLNWSFTY